MPRTLQPAQILPRRPGPAPLAFGLAALLLTAIAQAALPANAPDQGAGAPEGPSCVGCHSSGWPEPAPSPAKEAL
jgi:hypothetical protein